MGLEAAANGSLVDYDQGFVADDAAGSVGVLERQEAAIFASRVGDTRTRQVANEDSQPTEGVVLMGAGGSDRRARSQDERSWRRPARTIRGVDLIGSGVRVAVERVVSAQGE